MLPLYIPNDLTSILKKCSDPAQSEFIAKFLSELAEKGFVLKKKIFGKRIVFTINADNGSHPHRLIFEKVFCADSPLLLLKDIAWEHEYSKALRAAPILEIEAKELEHYTVLGHSSTETAEEVSMVLHHHKWFKLTNPQFSILNHSSLPLLVVGPPGSGKTLTILAKFQEMALQHQLIPDNPSLNMAFVTPNASLRDSVKISYDNWAKKNLESTPPVNISFLTPDELYSIFESYKDKALQSIESFIANLKINLDSEILIAELKINAHVLYQDARNRLQFVQSNYKKLGLNKTIVHDQTLRAQIYNLFKSAFDKFSDKFIVPGFTPLEAIPEDSMFDFAAFDETECASMQEVWNLLSVTKNYQVIMVGDSIQKGDVKLSSLPLIGPALYHRGIKLSEGMLHGTLRLPYEIATFANDVILLLNNFKQGKIDSTAYSLIDLENVSEEFKNKKSLNLIQKETTDFKKFGRDAKSGVLILFESDREEAFRLTSSHNIFTVEQARGIEFNNVFIFLSKKGLESFIKVSELMLEKRIEAGTNLKKYEFVSKFKGQEEGSEYNTLSKLFVLLTRSLKSCTLFIEPLNSKSLSHKLNPFLLWIQHQISEKTLGSIEIAEEKEDWLEAINKFILNGQKKQAIENLLKHFNFSMNAAISYTNVNLHPQTVDELIKWRELNDNEKKSGKEEEVSETENAYRTDNTVYDLNLNLSLTYENEFDILLNKTINTFSSATITPLLKYWVEHPEFILWNNPSLIEKIRTPQNLKIFISCILNNRELWAHIPLDSILQYLKFENVSELYSSFEKVQQVFILHQHLDPSNTKASIFLAFEKKNMDLVKWIIEHKVNLSSIDDNGNSAVHYACQQKNIGLLKLLIQNKAALKLLNKDFVSAAEICFKNEDYDALKLLNNAKADFGFYEIKNFSFNKKEELLSFLNKLFKAHPLNYRIMNMYVDLLTELERNEESITILKNFETQNGSNANISKKLFINYVNKSDYIQADRYAEKLILINPRNHFLRMLSNLHQWRFVEAFNDFLFYFYNTRFSPWLVIVPSSILGLSMYFYQRFGNSTNLAADRCSSVDVNEYGSYLSTKWEREPNAEQTIINYNFDISSLPQKFIETILQREPNAQFSSLGDKSRKGVTEALDMWEIGCGQLLKFDYNSDLKTNVAQRGITFIACENITNLGLSITTQAPLGVYFERALICLPPKIETAAELRTLFFEIGGNIGLFPMYKNTKFGTEISNLKEGMGCSVMLGANYSTVNDFNACVSSNCGFEKYAIFAGPIDYELCKNLYKFSDFNPIKFAGLFTAGFLNASTQSIFQNFLKHSELLKPANSHLVTLLLNMALDPYVSSQWSNVNFIFSTLEMNALINNNMKDAEKLQIFRYFYTVCKAIYFYSLLNSETFATAFSYNAAVLLASLLGIRTGSSIGEYTGTTAHKICKKIGNVVYSASASIGNMIPNGAYRASSYARSFFAKKPGTEKGEFIENKNSIS